jgi:hypothetical protein
LSGRSPVVVVVAFGATGEGVYFPLEVVLQVKIIDF